MDRDYYGHNEERWQQQYQTSQESRFPLPTGYPLEPRIDQFNQQNAANLYAALNTVPSQTTPAIQPPFQWHGPYSHQGEPLVGDGLHMFNHQAEERIVIPAQQLVTNNQASSSNGASLYDFVLPQDVNISFSPTLRTPVHSYINQSPPPALPPMTPLASIPTDEILGFYTTPPASSVPPQFAHLLTNFSKPEQVDLRNFLVECLSSDWLRLKQLEPTFLPKQSILLRFLSRPTPASNFRCLFDGCSKGFDRRDRAVGHIRTHLEHKPFLCDGQCEIVGCNRRFYSRPHLDGHIKSPKGVCELCEKLLFHKNLPRHRLTCPRVPQVDLA